VIRAVSFDFWNTLFCEQADGFTFYQSRRLGLLQEALRDHGEFSLARLDAACLSESESHYRIWRSEFRTLSAADRVRAILADLRMTLDDDRVAGLVLAFEEGILERPPVLVDGVRQTLDQLSPRYRLGIISDVGFSPGRVLRQILAANEILDLFDHLVFSDEVGCSKPHAKVFETMAQALGSAPHEMAHIGDLEFTDIVGARRAGYRAIRYTGVNPLDDGEITDADFVINDYSGLPGLLDRL
jgi:putative hydrolase of the HAD superfamily